MDYCYGANREQLNKIIKLQAKCLQLIQPKGTSSSLNILGLEDMIKLENMKFGYKPVHHMLPLRIAEICHEDSQTQSLTKTHKYSTRNKNVPNLPVRMNKQYRESFLCKGPQSWLTLSVETKEKHDLKSFARKCKDTLLNN